MSLSMVPGTVMADEAGNTQNEPAVESCQKTEGCVLEDGHEGDCVTEDAAEPTPALTPSPTPEAENSLEEESEPAENSAEEPDVPSVKNTSEITTVEELEQALKSGGEFVLGADITIEDGTFITIPAGVEVVLELNGRTKSLRQRNGSVG